MTTVRQFLHTADSQIDIHQPWLIPPLRQADRFLMEVFLESKLYNKSELAMLNRVRLFLQVTRVSDITDHTG